MLQIACGLGGDLQKSLTLIPGEIKESFAVDLKGLLAPLADHFLEKAMFFSFARH